MVSEEPARNTIKRLRKAGFERTDAEGSHSKWSHPLGPWVSIADGHRTTSPGVVRQVNKAIAEAQRLAKEEK
jgi:predicted RNA binding protein YcfA (HicA-like mRNA interferase family)